jgi:predicted lipid-binding transport protein (Tim44 family)
MDELIARVSAAVGVEASVAQVAIGQVLGFLQKEFPEGPVSDLLAKLPGAKEAIAAAEAPTESAGGLGGMLGGLMGGAGGLMGLAGRLGSLGLEMGQMRTLAKEIFAHAEGLIGKENVEKIANGIPGLSQFL